LVARLRQNPGAVSVDEFQASVVNFLNASGGFDLVFGFAFFVEVAAVAGFD